MPAGSSLVVRFTNYRELWGVQAGAFGVNLEKSSLQGMWMEIIDNVGAIINRPIEKIITMRLWEMKIIDNR